MNENEIDLIHKEGVIENLYEHIERLKKEVNDWHRKYFDKSILLNDWEAHEYDNDYDDEVASENMRDQREAYKPLYPEVTK
jgi:hypothetical protein